MNPWQMALDAMFQSPGSLDAIFVSPEGLPTQIRVIRSQPDQLERYAGTQFFAGTNAFEIRVSDVAAPVIGDQILFAGDQTGALDTIYTVSLPPICDVDGLSWTCVAELTS